MHLLHQSHRLRGAVLAAVAAAVLAISLTLAIAPGLHDLGSSPAAAGAPAPQAVVNTSAVSLPTGDLFTHGGFSGPFTTPMPLPWASAKR